MGGLNMAEPERENGEEGRNRDGRSVEDQSPDFNSFITGLYTQTLSAMGLLENPQTGEKRISLNEAQFLIDTIGMLEEKTRGNLTEQEAGYLQEVLNDLRMRYVKAAQSGEKGGESGKPEEPGESDRHEGPDNTG